MRVLVTGARGFVGGYLLDHLLECGDQVIATCDPVTAFPGDIPVDVRDREGIAAAVQQSAPDAIIHLAAISFVPEAEADTPRTLDINVAGVDHLCRAIKQLEHPCRLVFASSPEVYGPVSTSDMPLTEGQPHRPNSNYGLSKSFAEAVIRRWRTEGVEATIVRPFNHIGPRQNDRFVTSSFARQLALIRLGKKEPVLRVGNLEAARDFTDVRDIVGGYRRVAESGGDTFHLCSGRPITIQQVLDRLIWLSGLTVEVRQDPDRMRPSDIPLHIGSSALAAEHLGWEPTIPLDQTLTELLEYWSQIESAAS